MGGETLATPPGFHYFVTTMILLTGMPIILAELVTAAFYSSIIVFPAYLASKRIWKNSSAGIIAAFFAAASALSLEMISWGGYTNIVSLSLIITIFYLFIKDINTPKLSHLVVGAVLFGSLIITHTFSLFIVFPILAVCLILLLIGKWKKVEDIKIKNLFRFFVISVTAGIAMVSPWILRVFNFYISASAQGAATGGLDNKNLILANRTVGIVILGLLIVVIPAVYMFKSSRKRPYDSQSLLVIAWFIVPVVMTQAYLFGVVTDYSRFMYFIDFPGIIIISAGLLYLFRYTTIAIKKTQKIRLPKIQKTFPITVLTASIFIFIIVSPWSIFPEDAMNRANFYSTIQEPEASTIEWIRNNTAEDSILVADHLYGWWLGGIGERSTLSAAELEFLIYAHELEVAKAAQLLLDTNYYIDNGLIQVRDTGGYPSSKDIEFSIDTLSGESWLFSIQEEGIVLWYKTDTQEDNEPENGGNRTLANMTRIGTPTITKDENSVNITVRYEDDLFIVNRTLTVKQGERFAELSYDVEIKGFQTFLYNIWFPLYVTGEGSMTIDDSFSWYGYYYWNKVCGQVIFQEHLPPQIDFIKEDPQRVQMLFRYPRQRVVRFNMLVGGFDAKDLSWPDEVIDKYDEFLEAAQESEKQEPVTVWTYTEMIEKYGVSYVVSRDQENYTKFGSDPTFRLVFNSGNVAVFQVVK